MALPNQKFREIVFQLLYGLDMGDPDPKQMIALLMNELAVTRKNVAEAQLVVDKILTHKEELDAKISANCDHYEFERIHSVERNILRLGIYEMLYDDEIPGKVAISEAMRLAKKFSTGDARGFVNAIMDKIYKQMPSENNAVD